MNLQEALRFSFEDKENIILCNSILGSIDAHHIAAELDNFCIHLLGSAIFSALYIGFSVGASFGLELENGMRIFIKIHRPTPPGTITAISHASLTAVSSVQKSLAEIGFPCPRVVGEPMEFGAALATVDVFSVPGELKDAHNPAIRGSIARTLAQLIQLTEPYKSVNGLTYGRFCADDTLYPIPHNELFNFERTSQGAEWIDAIAERAKTLVTRINGREVLGHLDWSLKHFRFQRDEVVMVYDWDSLKLEDELNVLGIAAATFTTTWDIPVRITPSQEESLAFVNEYEQARGTKISSDERAKISAAATYCMAYVARCEHALDSHGNNYDGSFRQALAAMRGDLYLDV
ncbi:aminoglycoside phosphotransferase (APT) family kinase protein [Paenibacillus taihuensis]|uniref:Aminoglycoside phosphotransferase (APT) family kinase protein n=1 Tax=Paenibacillus taihuensis TaxID=1156355 RepID=A0A3D9SFE7_9BACL|nr:hypothetical protein [Paenibacillus taihuensis]REE94619.1 aminoglycoside phosphotransferase (APT) family kinase protein [Paenibacillus taihuensis]